MKLREWIRARTTMKLMAAREGRTMAELRQDIQEAIDEAWRNPDGREAQQDLFPKGKPSPEAFIVRLSQELQLGDW